MSKLKKALEKAREARGDQVPEHLQSTGPSPFPAKASAGAMPQVVQKPLKPVYTTTKVVQCDSIFLRKNRVISICTEDRADSLKILRSQIINRMTEEGKNTLMVTSANPGEGKTLTAINLAISFSQQFSRTVLLVDGDIKKPSIHRYLGLDEGPGLSECILGKAEVADVLINPGMDRLVVLPGGHPRTNSSEMLGSPSMKTILKEIKERYPERFIIFDTAPVLTSADPMIFSGFMDAIIIVVEAEKTRQEDIKRVFELMPNRPVIGTILNKSLD